ncbi:MAG TPA: protein-disulfide reductase DsbD domain-containing protein [Candidatus Angelobacter sp.]
MKPAKFAAKVMSVVMLCGIVFSQESGSSQGRGYVEFDPLDTVSVTPGQTKPVQFTFHVKNGYHINSNKPTTEELIPTTLGFTPPPDLVIAKVQYPPGQLTSFPFDPTQKLSVYSGDVIIKAAIIPQPHAPSGTYTVHGEFRYQACDNNACYPPKKLPVQFDLKVAKAKKSRPRPTRQSPNIH